ncbi:MAG: lipopolysaccharide transport periplasmic protein LptA [Gammaproteobacteria bacterium]|nr:lipopolysaccharide transport periplasmic protein LptA [Gammaproteobacteria bacterium]
MNHKVISLLLLMLSPGIALALTSDREQPIQIEADSMVIDEGTGVSVYQGSVSYVQGTVKMTADKVTIYSVGGEFQRFSAEGERVRYQQMLDDGKGELKAKARLIDYRADQGHILLKGNAYMIRGGDEFSGSHIEYDADKDIVNARKAENGGERVQVVIQPREKGKVE